MVVVTSTAACDTRNRALRDRCLHVAVSEWRSCFVRSLESDRVTYLARSPRPGRVAAENPGRDDLPRPPGPPSHRALAGAIRNPSLFTSRASWSPVGAALRPDLGHRRAGRGHCPSLSGHQRPHATMKGRRRMPADLYVDGGTSLRIVKGGVTCGGTVFESGSWKIENFYTLRLILLTQRICLMNFSLWWRWWRRRWWIIHSYLFAEKNGYCDFTFLILSSSYSHITVHGRQKLQVAGVRRERKKGKLHQFSGARAAASLKAKATCGVCPTSVAIGNRLHACFYRLFLNNRRPELFVDRYV